MLRNLNMHIEIYLCSWSFDTTFFRDGIHIRHGLCVFRLSFTVCHLPDFITFFFIVVYVALIKQAVVERRRWCKSAQHYQSTVSNIIIHKSMSYQGLSQRGINEKSVCIRGRSAKQWTWRTERDVFMSPSRIVIIEMFIHNEYYTWLYLQSFILQHYQSTVSNIIIHYIWESRPHLETSIKI
jgi:hypothetical protein